MLSADVARTVSFRDVKKGVVSLPPKKSCDVCLAFGAPETRLLMRVKAYCYGGKGLDSPPDVKFAMV